MEDPANFKIEVGESNSIPGEAEIRETDASEEEGGVIPDWQVQCPSRECKAPLLIASDKFAIMDHPEDGTRTVDEAIECYACRLVFAIDRSRVTFIRIAYPTLAESRAMRAVAELAAAENKYEGTGK